MIGPLYPRQRDPVPVLREAGWSAGPVWTSAENLAPTGIFFVFSCNLFLLHPYLFLCLHCHAFYLLLFLQHNTNIHAPGRIRTRNPSMQSGADPRFRSLCHGDRQGFDPRPCSLWHVAIPTDLSRHPLFFFTKGKVQCL